MSGSEQWAVGEGLSVVLSQSLGLRERLDLLNILGSDHITDSHVGSDELEVTCLLDDERLELVRRYFRGLESNAISAVNMRPSNKVSSTSVVVFLYCGIGSFEIENYILVRYT